MPQKLLLYFHEEQILKPGRVFKKVYIQKLYKKHYKTLIKVMVYKSYLKAL